MAAKINKETLDFFKLIKKNNDREWFKKNKHLYEKANANIIEFTTELIKLIAAFDKPVALLSPKDCMYRIYRDTRFSNDKTPYKTHAGIHITSAEKKMGSAGYYLHIEPGNNLLGGGVYHPDPDRLRGMRQEIDYNAKDFLKIINNKTFKSTFGEIVGDRLKTVPKGYDKENPMLEYLQMKEYLTMKSVDDDLMLADDFIKVAAKTFKVMHPFNEFLNLPMKD